MTAGQPEERSEPLLRIVKGDPTPEELAAVLAVVAASSETPSQPPRGTGSGWSAYWRNVRAPLQPGPGAWRGSGSPG